MRTFILPLAITGTLLITGCTSSAPSNRNNGGAKSASSSKAPTQEPHSTLRQQKMCADQAEVYFRKQASAESSEDRHETLDASYVDHYDVKTNTCYVAIVRTLRNGKGLTFQTSVFDAFEGTDYAGYIQTSSRVKNYMEVKAPSWCSIHPRNHIIITCKSEEEFDSLIEKYFGLVIQ